MLYVSLPFTATRLGRLAKQARAAQWRRSILWPLFIPDLGPGPEAAYRLDTADGSGQRSGLSSILYVLIAPPAF